MPPIAHSAPSSVPAMVEILITVDILLIETMYKTLIGMVGYLRNILINMTATMVV